MIVLQKALISATEPYKTIFFNTIAPHLEKLQNLPFGQKLYAKLLTIYPELKFVKIGTERKASQNFQQIHKNPYNSQTSQNIHQIHKNPYDYQNFNGPKNFDSIYTNTNMNLQNSQNVNILPPRNGNVNYFNNGYQTYNVYRKNVNCVNNMEYDKCNIYHNQMTQNNVNRNNFNGNNFQFNRIANDNVNRNFNMFQK